MTIVLRCTQSAKTVWVKTLLENAQTTISPPPEGIIWCYGQWQPMHLEMIDTLPGVEFYEGIPSEIDSQHFLTSINVTWSLLTMLWHSQEEAGA